MIFDASTVQYCHKYDRNKTQTVADYAAIAVFQMCKYIQFPGITNARLTRLLSKALENAQCPEEHIDELINNAIYISELSFGLNNSEILLGGISPSLVYGGNTFIIPLYALVRHGSKNGVIVFDPYGLPVVNEDYVAKVFYVQALMLWAKRNSVDIDFIEYITRKGSRNYLYADLQSSNSLIVNIRNIDISYSLIDTYVRKIMYNIVNVYECEACKQRDECWNVKGY